MRNATVRVDECISSVKSIQCSSCDSFDFEPESAKKVISELKSKETIP